MKNFKTVLPIALAALAWMIGPAFAAAPPDYSSMAVPPLMALQGDSLEPEVV